MKNNFTPIALCLMTGIGLAFVLTTRSKHNAVTAPTVAISTNKVAAIAFWEEGYSNIVTRKLAATNAQERASWEAIEKQYTNMDWQTIARSLGVSPSWRPGQTNP